MSADLVLKYGLNPHQKPAHLSQPASAPLQVLNGQPGYINLLDAIGAWRLVRELGGATGQPAAASFKHTSPAGAAITGELTEVFLASQFLRSGLEVSAVANAYIRARGGDRMSAFGDFVAVSDVVDDSLADILAREVSDGIIAPGYAPSAFKRLQKKKGGSYLILQMDPNYQPEPTETRTQFGLTLSQSSPDLPVTRESFANVVTANQHIPEAVVDTLVVATVALKYAQSNSICLAYEGQVVGLGAGQQSRIHCTRLACEKAEKWFMAQHPRVAELAFAAGLKRPDKANVVDGFLLWEQLSAMERTALLGQLRDRPEPLSAEERSAWLASFDGIALSSDAYLPFRDNVDRAHRSNVQYIGQTGGSARDGDVTAAADEHGMAMAHTGMRWFLH